MPPRTVKRGGAAAGTRKTARTTRGSQKAQNQPVLEVPEEPVRVEEIPVSPVEEKEDVKAEESGDGFNEFVLISFNHLLLRRIKSSEATLSGEFTPYNIVPLEAPSLTNAIGIFPEVRSAISAIRYTEHFPRLPDDYVIVGDRDADMFDLLEIVFGFQIVKIQNAEKDVFLHHVQGHMYNSTMVQSC